MTEFRSVSHPDDNGLIFRIRAEAGRETAREEFLKGEQIGIVEHLFQGDGVRHMVSYRYHGDLIDIAIQSAYQQGLASRPD